MNYVKRYASNPVAILFYAFLMAAGLMLATSAHAQPGGKLLRHIPVAGTTTEGVFEGRLTITNLSRNEAGQLLASGVLMGRVDGGRTVRQTFEDVVMGLTASGGSGISVQQLECDILFLDLGPIYLNVLGLEVDLSEIELDINAVPGGGNLLGNLLCAVAGLLDGFAIVGIIAEILDQILEAINELL